MDSVSSLVSAVSVVASPVGFAVVVINVWLGAPSVTSGVSFSSVVVVSRTKNGV